MSGLPLELVHFFLGFLLLIIMNVIGSSPLLTAKYTSFSDFFSYDSSVGFNAILRILAPSIFAVIISIIFYLAGAESLTSNIWHVAVYYALIQAAIVFIVLGRGRLVKKSKFLLYHTIAIALAYWVYHLAIIKGLSYLLPDEANFRTEMWFIIILFMYGLFTHMSEDRDKFEDRQNDYVESKLNLFEASYKSLLKNKSPLLRDVIYSLMIYEDYVRPAPYRIIERILVKFKFAKTTGLMQVRANHALSDKESIKLTIAKLNDIYNSFDLNLQKHEKLNLLIRAHNADDLFVRRVSEIYELVEARHAKI